MTVFLLKKNMKILFIQTGGTIDKDYPQKLRSYAFVISDPAVKTILKMINPSFKFKIMTVVKKDSLDITGKDRKKIHELCQKSHYNKIIITHGTDTMIKTAETLKDITDKAIILTGAMKPEKFYDSDARFNIGCAIGAVNIIEKGIFIAMNGKIFDWDNCKKTRLCQFVKKLPSC